MTTKSEKAADLLERNMWIFHSLWFGYFIVAGTKDLICYIQQ